VTGRDVLDSAGCRLGPSRTAAQPERAAAKSQVADLLLGLDALASIREISPSVGRYLGYRRGELLGSDFFKILHADDAALVRSLLLGDQSPVPRELRIRHQRGGWRSFSIEARMAPGPNRQALLIIEGSDTSACEPELLLSLSTMQIGGNFVQVPDRAGEGEPRGGDEALSPDLIERARAQSETVLVALDDVRVSAQVCGVMRQLGYDVLEASSPADAEGFARVHQGAIHLLVTDLATPRVRGRAFVRAMQAIRPGLKSLFVSRQGYGSLAERRVYESGARLLHQPFTSEELAHALRRALESSRD
jgi:CheY-like chemotaxis protein/PAS domain-containing protein